MKFLDETNKVETVVHIIIQQRKLYTD